MGGGSAEQVSARKLKLHHNLIWLNVDAINGWLYLLMNVYFNGPEEIKVESQATTTKYCEIGNRVVFSSPNSRVQFSYYGSR